MRNVIRLFVALAMLGGLSGVTTAQEELMMLPDTATGSLFPGDGTGAAAPFLTQLNTSFPGRTWFGLNIVDNGLGYDNGGYFFLGGKMRLGEDYFAGRWLLEGQFNLGYEDGQSFGNIGLERVFTIAPARTDVGASIWYDVDKSHRGNLFQHNFNQIGVTGFIRNEMFTLQTNGYIPIGDTGHIFGDPVLNSCFFGNSILFRHGIDTAMAGFDSEIRLRPFSFTMVQGTVDLGGYYYRDVDEAQTGVKPFGGVRVRAGITALKGTTAQIEINHDDRFKTTGFLRFVMSSAIFGAYDPLGMDLNRTERNNHVVVVHQDPIIALNATGGALNVIHVDNSNTNASGGNGTFENPYSSLTLANGVVNPGNSAPGDIIFVREGNADYEETITLLNGQQLLGDGVRHLIPTNAGNFLLCNDLDDLQPNINGVALAGNNVVRGFTVTPFTGGTGVFGQNITAAANNLGTTIDQVRIDNSLTPAANVNGYVFNNIDGLFTITDSDLSNTCDCAIVDTTGVALQIANLGAAGNIEFNCDITNIVPSGRTIDINTTAVGSVINIRNGNQITDDQGAGIFMNGVAGTVQVLTPQTITNSTAQGILVQNSPGVVRFANTTINNLGLLGNNAIVGVDLMNNIGAGQLVQFTNLTVDERFDAAVGTTPIAFRATDVTNLLMTGNNTLASIGDAAGAVEGSGNAALILTRINTAGIGATGLDATINSVTSSFSATNGVLIDNVHGNTALIAAGMPDLNINFVDIDQSTGDSFVVQNITGGNPFFGSYGTVDIDGAGIAMGAFANGVRINNTPFAQNNFGVLDIMTDNGNGLFATTGGILNTTGGTIVANGGAAIIINPTQFGLTFGSVSSINSISDGISIDGVAVRSPFITTPPPAATTVQSTLSISTTNIADAENNAIRVANIDDVNIVDSLFDLVADFGTTTISDVLGTAPDTDGGIIISNNNMNNATMAARGNAQTIFNSANVTVTNGDGINLNNAGTVDFAGSGASVDATSGTAIDITGSNTSLATGFTFNTVTSALSGDEGVRLDSINNDFTITGTTTITDPLGDAIRLQNVASNPLGAGAISVTINSIIVDNAGNNVLEIQNFGDASALPGNLIPRPTFTLNGGIVTNQNNATAINVTNFDSDGADPTQGADANISISNVNVTFGAVLDGIRGISVRSGDGNVTLSGNVIDLASSTNSDGIFIEGNNPNPEPGAEDPIDANNLFLGVGQSTGNQVLNFGGVGTNVIQFNNGNNIEGDIETNGVTDNP